MGGPVLKKVMRVKNYCIVSLSMDQQESLRVHPCNKNKQEKA
jgi:hypothetical protein